MCMFFKKQPTIPLLWIVWLGIIAIAVIGILLSQPSAPISDPSKEAIDETQWQLREDHYASLVAETGAGVLIADQVTGKEVTVTSATMPASGFLVIFGDDDGAPGERIGSLKLEKGVHENVLVPLSQEVQSGEVCYAVVTQENIDQKESLYDTGDPILDADGAWVLMSFQILGIE